VHWCWNQLGPIVEPPVGETSSTKELRYWAQLDDEGQVPTFSIGDMPSRDFVASTERATSKKVVVEEVKRRPKGVDSLLKAFRMSGGKAAMVNLDEAFFNEAIKHVDIDDVGVHEYLLWILPIMAGIGSKNRPNVA
jgi:hypothetical protein